jgi:hypothetical protein
MKGFVFLILRNADGLVKFASRLENVITNAGHQLLIDRLQADSPAAPSYIAIGTGTTLVSPSDTALVTETVRSQGTLSQPTSYAARCSYTFGPGVATGNIREAGLLNAAADGTLFSRRLFAPIAKGATDSLQVIWDITYPAGVGMMFADTFSDPDGIHDRYGPLDDPWVDLGEPFDQDIGKCFSGDDTSIAIVDTVSFANGYVQARLTGTFETGRLVLRWSTGEPILTNCYSAVLTPTAVQLYRGATLLAETSGTYAVGALLRLEAVGAAVTVNVDSITAISYTDAGKTGIYATGASSMQFDDFECGTI